VKWWLALGLLLAGCVGGQTGQPGSADIPGTCDVSPNQPVNGQSPAELARRYEGSHSSRMRWVTIEPRDGGTMVANDEITIDVRYRGEGGTSCDGLSVPVTVVVTTKNNGVNETGTGSLTASLLGSAILDFNDQHVTVSATLWALNGAFTMSGKLYPHDGTLSGDFGEFPPSADGGAP